MVENRSYAKQKVIVLNTYHAWGKWGSERINKFSYMRLWRNKKTHNYPTCKDGWIACMFEEGIWGGVNGTLTL